MDRKNVLIAVLSMTAGFLLATNLLIQPAAQAQVAVKDRDFQVVTGRIQGGGDGVYILDNRTGQIAIFSYDPGARMVRPRDVRMMTDTFGMGFIPGAAPGARW
jgi:hypothetical protein